MLKNEEQNDGRVRRPQDDLPYERRMLYIIRDYRRLTSANETLETYAKQLEKENERLRGENDRLKRENENWKKVKQPNEGMVTAMQGLLNEKRDLLTSQRAQISLLLRELDEYKKLYGEL